MAEGGEKGGHRHGKGPKSKSAIDKLSGRLRFTAELHPEETTTASWTKFLREADPSYSNRPESSMCPSFEAPASFVSQPPSPPVASYALKNTMNELKVSQVQTGFNRVVTANGLDLSIQQKEKCGFIEKIDINAPPSRASMQIVVSNCLCHL